MPHFLILALWEHGAAGLTLISNTAGITMTAGFGAPGGVRYIDHSILIEKGLVKKVVASFPVAGNPSRVTAFERAFREGLVELEVAPQGTLVERIRAGGSGIAAFYTPTGAGTLVAEGKETRSFDGREYVLERALTADFALVRAWKGDTLGNLVYPGELSQLQRADGDGGESDHRGGGRSGGARGAGRRARPHAGAVREAHRAPARRRLAGAGRWRGRWRDGLVGEGRAVTGVCAHILRQAQDGGRGVGGSMAG